MKLPAHTVQTTFASPLGSMILAATDGQLVGAWFAGQAHLPDLSLCPSEPHNPLLRQASTELTEYFAGQRSVFTLALNMAAGTAFEQAVWSALPTIACGTTCSYGALASQIGKPTAVRAVGAAIGRNPWSIINPCHRVIGRNGSLTGYAGGLHRKTALLHHEGVL